MNKTFTILTTAIVTLAMAACDHIDENNRFTESTEINPEKKVLVEEFTGQFCPNCPLGHEALKNIKALYGNNAVIVSIHSGDMAFDDPDYGLKTPDGDAYASQYGIDYYPSAIVNKMGEVMTDRSKWQGAVFSAARKSLSAGITISAHLTDGNTLEVESTLTSKAGNLDAKYQLWVTEDSITSLQLDGEEYIAEYVHNHVYRASLNGVGGESVSISESGTTLSHSIRTDARWTQKHLNIVAFIYNADGVLQAEETKVKEKAK